MYMYSPFHDNKGHLLTIENVKFGNLSQLVESDEENTIQ